MAATFSEKCKKNKDSVKEIITKLEKILSYNI